MWFGLDKLFTGYSADELQAQSDAADAALQALNQQKLATGGYTQSQYDAANADIAKGNLSTGAGDVSGSIQSAFNSGLQDGLNNVRNTVGKTISGVFNIFPWQLWLVFAFVVFVWIGGPKWLKGAMNK